MKRIIVGFCLTISAFSVFAQDQPKKKSERDEKKEARREKINNLIRQQEEGALVFNKQSVFGFRLNTDGWSILYEKGYLKSVSTTNLFSLEFGEKKHPKEKKLNNILSNSGFLQIGSPYVYGKQNSFYQLKPTFGQQRLLGGKTNKNGVAVTAIYAGGISTGLERPYYVRVQDSCPDDTRAIDPKNITLECKTRMPAYMVPAGIEVVAGPLPRNPNGKIDRKLLSTGWVERHMGA